MKNAHNMSLSSQPPLKFFFFYTVHNLITFSIVFTNKNRRGHFEPPFITKVNCLYYSCTFCRGWMMTNKLAKDKLANNALKCTHISTNWAQIVLICIKRIYIIQALIHLFYELLTFLYVRLLVTHQHTCT